MKLSHFNENYVATIYLFMGYSVKFVMECNLYTNGERGYCASVERGAGSKERGFSERGAGIIVRV
jgi:hypothetical protein